MTTPINISASRGAAILGLSKWKTPVQAWLEIIEQRKPGFCATHNYKLPEFEYNTAMQFGHAFESAIISISEKKAKTEIIKLEKLSKHREHKFITCHQDGEYKGTTDLHEGKTGAEYYIRDNFGEPGTDQIPVEYQIQCQHLLLCNPRKKRVVLSLLTFPRRQEEFFDMGWSIQQHENPNYYYLFNEKEQNATTPENWARVLLEMGYFHQYIITPHEELQSMMLEKYVKFWNENIIGEKEPEPANLDDLKSVYRDPIGTVIATSEIEYLCSELENIKSEISGTGTLAKRAEMIKVSILDFIRKSDSTIDDESRVKTVLRRQDGKKLMQYGKNKNDVYILR